MKKRNNEILRIFANNLKKYRKRMNLSQEELAFKCNLHRTYIGMVERAEKNITLLNVDVIANTLNIPIAKLLEDDDEQTI
jgi:transcriptional regulator with XRE-family HTH domain